MEDSTQSRGRPVTSTAPLPSAAIVKVLGQEMDVIYPQNLPDESGAWQSVRTGRRRQQAPETNSEQRAMPSKRAHSDSRHAGSRSQQSRSSRTGYSLAPSGPMGHGGTDLPVTGAQVPSILGALSSSARLHNIRPFVQSREPHLPSASVHTASLLDARRAREPGSAQPSYQQQSPSRPTWRSGPSQQQSRQQLKQLQQPMHALNASRQLIASAAPRLFAAPSNAGHPAGTLRAISSGPGFKERSVVSPPPGLLSDQQRQNSANGNSSLRQVGDTVSATQGGGSGGSGSGMGTGGGGGSGSSAAAILHERLLAQARRSAFDPATDKVRCRACGKAFSTYTQLAQHLAAAHDGINSEDAKYLQFKRQQQQQEQLQHNEQQLRLTMNGMFPSLQVLQQQQVSQAQWTGQMGAQGAGQGRGLRLRGVQSAGPVTEAAEAAEATAAGPAVFTTAPIPSMGSSGPLMSHEFTFTSMTRDATAAFPQGLSPPSFQTHQGQAQVHVSISPPVPKLAWAPAPVPGRLDSTQQQQFGGGSAVKEAAVAATVAAVAPSIPAAIPNAWAAKRLPWQTVSQPETIRTAADSANSVSSFAGCPVLTGTLTSGEVRGPASKDLPDPSFQPGGWFMGGVPKAVTRSVTRGAGASGGAKGVATPTAAAARATTHVNASATASATAVYASNKPSKRVVTLADLLDAAVSGSGSHGATARGKGAPGAHGSAVRVSNSLRIVMKAPSAKSQHLQTQNAAGSSTAPASGKRRVLTAAGTVAAPRKKHISRAKKLILQHRANRTLAEAADAYQRARHLYRSVVVAYTAMQAELNRLQQEGKEGGASGSSSSSTPGHQGAAPSGKNVEEGAASATGTGYPVPARTVGTALVRTPESRTAEFHSSATTRGITASARALPPSLRPQLLMLALTKAYPQLVSAHKTLVQRRTAYVAKLKHHATVHRQGEPSEAELAEQAPLDLLPQAVGAGAQSSPVANGSAELAGDGSRGGGGGAGGDSSGSDDSVSDDEVAEGFQDVLRRWAEVLRLPCKLYDVETSPSSGSSPNEFLSWPGTSTIGNPLTAAQKPVTSTPVVTVHSLTISQPRQPGPAPDAVIADATDVAAASSMKPCEKPQHQTRQQQQKAALAAKAAVPIPTAAAAGPAARSGLSLALPLKPPPERPAPAAASQSSLPAWLAPSGDTSDEEDEGTTLGAVSLFGGTGATAWAKATTGFSNAAEVSAVSMAPVSSPAAARRQMAPQLPTGNSSDEDDVDDEYAPGGWTDVLSRWRSKVGSLQEPALPLFAPNATGFTSSRFGGTSASRAFMPPGPVTMPTAAKSDMQASQFGGKAARSDPPQVAAAPTSTTAPRVGAGISTGPLQPAALGLIATPAAFTHMGLPAPCPSLLLPSTAAAAAAAAVFASAAAALAPAAAAEEDDEGDEGQLSPEAATAAAALILQRRDVIAHVQQAQAQVQAQMQHVQQQTQALGTASTTHVSALLDMTSAAAGTDVSDGIPRRENGTRAAGARRAAGLGPAAPAALGSFGGAMGAGAVGAAAAASLTATKPAFPSAPQPAASSWMKSLMADDQEDEDEDDEDLQSASGGLNVNVLANWMASVSLPKMTDLFKRQQELMLNRQSQQYAFLFSPYSAPVPAMVSGSGGTKQPVAGRTQASGKASGGSNCVVPGSAGNKNSSAAAGPAASSSASAGLGAGASTGPAGGIKIVHRAVSADAPSKIPQPQTSQLAAVSQRKQVQWQQQQPRQSASSSVVGTASTGTTATKAATSCVALHGQRAAAGSDELAKLAVQLLTRAGVIGGSSPHRPPKNVSTAALPPAKSGSSTRLSRGPDSGGSAVAAAATPAAAASEAGRSWLPAPQKIPTVAPTPTGSATLSGITSSRTSAPSGVAPAHVTSAVTVSLSVTAGYATTVAAPQAGVVSMPSAQKAGSVSAPQVVPANAWSKPLSFSSATRTQLQAGPTLKGTEEAPLPDVQQQWEATAPSGRVTPQRTLALPAAAVASPWASAGPHDKAGETAAGQRADMEASTKVTATHATTGQANEKEVQQILSPPQPQQQQQQLLPPEFKCDLCQVHCNSQWTFEQHCASRKHMSRAANAGLPLPNPDTVNGDRGSGSGGGAQEEGPRPVVGGEAMGRGTDAAVAAAAGSSAFSCALCGVFCNSDMTFQQHLASRKHLARAARQLLQEALPGEDRQLPQQPSPPVVEAMQQRRRSLESGAVSERVEKNITTMRSGVGAGPGRSASGGHDDTIDPGGGGGGAMRISTTPGASVPGAAQPAGSVRQGGSARGSPASAQPHRLCQQLLLPELDALVLDTLTRIRGFQERAMARNAIKASAHRWYVLGLREVHKAVRTKRAKVVIIAPNIEEVAVEGGLDTTLLAILDMCSEQGTVAVFALSRKHLGRVYGFKKKVSAVAILEINGIHEAYGQITRLATQAKEGWCGHVAAAAASAGGQVPNMMPSSTWQADVEIEVDSDSSRDTQDEEGDEKDVDEDGAKDGYQPSSAKPNSPTKLRQDTEHQNHGTKELNSDEEQYRDGASGSAQREVGPSLSDTDKCRGDLSGDNHGEGAGGDGSIGVRNSSGETRGRAAHSSGKGDGSGSSSGNGPTATAVTNGCTTAKMPDVGFPSGGHRALNAAAAVFVPRFARA